MDVGLREAKALERGIARARWGAAATALVLGPFFPNLSLVAVVALGLVAVAYNLLVLRASERAQTLPAHARVERIAFAADLLTLSLAMFLFSPDPYWTTFMVGIAVIVAGAFRFGTEGTIASGIVIAAAYLAITAFREGAFGYPVEPQRVAFHLSVFGVTAVLVDRVLGESRAVRAERERLIEALERRIEEQQALVAVGRVVASARGPSEIVPALLRASQAVFRFERATVFTIDEQRGEYRAIYRLTDPGEQTQAPSFKIGEGLVAAALAEGGPLLVRDVLADPRYVPRHLRERRRSVILVPLRVAGRPVAVLSLSRAIPDPFGPDDVPLAEVVASFVAQVLENERLFAAARQADALREADRMKDEFLATVSHELRTPLTIVRGALELLARGSERREQLVDQGLRNVERLQRAVQDLLDLAQLREARIPLEREFVRPRELLDETVRAHELMASERGQRLVVDCPPSAAPAYLDRPRMLQVLGNLLANAIRYSPEGTEVILACEQRDGRVRFRVVDRGPGVPPEERERIFDRFYRGERTRDGVVGTGLGLAIAKGIVELHGGTIWVEPAEPAGSAFVVTLPMDAAAAS